MFTLGMMSYILCVASKSMVTGYGYSLFQTADMLQSKTIQKEQANVDMSIITFSE